MSSVADIPLSNGLSPAVAVSGQDIPEVMASKRTVFFPNLDGLRFFCFLSVFFAHSFATPHVEVRLSPTYHFLKHTLLSNAPMGVNFFFVLSGFLITYLLLVEKQEFRTIRVGSFYMRRALRIWPLFYLCVGIGFFAFPLVKALLGQSAAETASMPYYLVFLNNFNYLKVGADASVLSTLWSIAVEEQFYVAWPLVLFIFPKKALPLAFAVIIAISFAFRYRYAGDELVRDVHTLSCISDMTVGGLFAYCAFYSASFIHKIKTTPKWLWSLLYLAVAVMFLFNKELTEFQPYQTVPHATLIAMDRLLISLLFGLVIVEQCYADHSLFKMSRFPMVSKLGTYTYGLYCLHMIAIVLVSQGLALLKLNTSLAQIVFIETPIAFIITTVMAVASYHLYERRFLKLKDRFARISKT